MTPRQSKVLIADDSKAVHQLICEALPDDYSAGVVHAFNGIECLNELDEGVDLAFIDVHMPTMGGMDALWAARIAGNKTFVTLISGAANRRCIDLARQIDAYEFLTKPFGSAEIRAILATHRRVAMPMQVLLVDAVEHAESGHVYEYVWFREQPYLRLPLVRACESATIPVADLMANAKKAAMLELENARLVRQDHAA